MKFSMRGAGGTRFSLKLVPIMNGEDVPLLATFIQQSLQAVGILGSNG
jgi:peptide/nickel transport system substrate-binding protein